MVSRALFALLGSPADVTYFRPPTTIMMTAVMPTTHDSSSTIMMMTCITVGPPLGPHVVPLPVTPSPLQTLLTGDAAYAVPVSAAAGTASMPTSSRASDTARLRPMREVS